MITFSGDGRVLTSPPTAKLALDGRVALVVGLHLEGVGRPLRFHLAVGESFIKCPSTLNVIKDTYDHSCHGARSDEYRH